MIVEKKNLIQTWWIYERIWSSFTIVLWSLIDLNNVTNCGSGCGEGVSLIMAVAVVGVSDSIDSVNQLYSLRNAESDWIKSFNEKPADCQNFCMQVFD